MLNYEKKMLAVVIAMCVLVVGAFLIFGWTGISRCTSGCVARTAGADWVVVQLDLTGQPFRCWELHDVSIANEANSDGIYWEQPSGNLIHISGLYNRVQVEDDQWDEAFQELGLTQAACQRVRGAEKAPADENWGVPGGG